jgi:hypothetical protein
MKKVLFAIIFVCISIALSFLAARYAGSYYSSLFGAGGAWIGSENSWNFIIGFPLVLIFFLIVTAYGFVFRSYKSVLWLISPLIIWEVAVDLSHIYITIILAFIAFGLATLLHRIFRRNTAPQIQ